MAKNIKIPIWITEFEEEIEELKKKTNDGDIYCAGQDSLKVLLRTGQGSCVATSKLFRMILRKHVVEKAFQMHIGSLNPKEQWDHQATVVVEKMGKFWYQSNDIVRMFTDYIELIKFAASEMGWTKNDFYIVKTYELNWC